MLRANSLFGSIFAPFLPQSSWLYNPLSTYQQQYILDPDWHTLALRMAQQRLQRPDQASLEDLRKLRSSSDSPQADGDASKDGRPDADGDQDVDADADPDPGRDLDSPDGSIEVDDRHDQDPKVEEVRSEDSLQADSPLLSNRSDRDNSIKDDETFLAKRLRPTVENLNEDLEDHPEHRHDLTVKIKLEGTVDLSTKRNSDKENMGQDLTTRKKDEDIDERESVRPRKDRSPKPRHVWRPY